MAEKQGPRPLVVTIGNKELMLRRRYEVLSISNDILVAVWFVVGSILFFSPETTEAGTWFFLLGSIELLIRPAIRLSRNVHMGRVRSADLHAPGAEVQEF